MNQSVHEFLWLPGVVYFNSFTNYLSDIMTYEIQGAPTVDFSSPWSLATQLVSGPTSNNIVVISNGGFAPRQFIRANLNSLSGKPSPFQSHIFTSGIPMAGNETVHLNLWLYGGAPGTSGQRFEVVISNFVFIPFNQIPRPKLGRLGVSTNELTIPFQYPGN